MQLDFDKHPNLLPSIVAEAASRNTFNVTSTGFATKNLPPRPKPPEVLRSVVLTALPSLDRVRSKQMCKDADQALTQKKLGI